MKKAVMFAVACVLTLGLSATNARADMLTPSGSYYLGFVQGVTPELANVSDEAAMINTLKNVVAGTWVMANPPVSQTRYDRTGSSITGPFPTADPAGVSSVSGSMTVSVNGFAYIIAKYDGPNVGDFVWYAPTGVYSLEDQLTNPVTGKQGGLSHYSVFAGSVPDGGMTLMLLGGVLVGLETLRRRFSV